MRDTNGRKMVHILESTRVNESIFFSQISRKFEIYGIETNDTQNFWYAEIMVLHLL